MSEKKFRGVYPPTITCFDQDGNFDPDKQRGVIRFLINKKVYGLFITGSYGSFPLMSIEERKQAAEVIFEETDGKVPIIVQIGTPDTKSALQLAKHAENLGASAVASVIPYYFSGFAYSEDQIIEYFRKLVDSVKIPVFLYNNPKTTGYNVSPKLLKKIADVGLKGIKDSSGDIIQMAEYIMYVQPQYTDFTFFTGTASLLMPSLMLGCQGGVAGTANAFPELVVNLYELYQSGEYKDAEMQQRVVLKVRELQGIDGFRPASCYAMLRMRGIHPGTVRQPWKEISKDKYEYVYQELKKLEIF